MLSIINKRKTGIIITFSCVQNVWVCFLSMGTAIFSKAVRTSSLHMIRSEQ